MEKTKLKTIEEILAMDTTEMSLDEMVSMLDSPSDRFHKDVLKLRLKKENESGIPMEEDSFSQEDADIGRKMFPNIYAKL